MAVSQQAFDSLKMELDTMKQFLAEQKKATGSVPKVAVSETMNVAAAALVDAFKGDGTGPTVREFFQQINQAAALGHWSDDDKTRVVVLKSKGPAATFLSTKFDLGKPLKFVEVEAAYMGRFMGKHTDQFNFMNLQNAVQKRGESVAQFSERIRQLGALTVRQTGDEAAQKVVEEEAERRMLASFLHGLQGKPGEVTRFRFPTKWEDAVQWATLVEAEEASKPSESSASVFQLTCWNCNREGHREVDCRSRSRNVVQRDRDQGQFRGRGGGFGNNYARSTSPGAGGGQYTEGRGIDRRRSGAGRGDNRTSSFERSVNNRNPSPSARGPDNNRRVRFNLSEARRNAAALANVVCYRCDRRGHYARECRVSEENLAKPGMNGRGSRGVSPLNSRGLAGNQ